MVRITSHAFNETQPLLWNGYTSVRKRSLTPWDTILNKWSNILNRRKVHKVSENNDKPKLARILGLVDLTSLGVGSTLGLGVYVLAGSVAKTTAGPAVTISFLIAAIASVLAGLCYAEFASRVPRAGSAYIYSYVTIGEFCAFVIGWNLILEYAIGTASVAKGLSVYLDNMMDNKMNKTLSALFPMNVSFLSPYPDFFAFGVVLLLTVLLAWGVRESSLVNNVFTVVNLLTVIVVIGAGLFKVHPSYWAIPKEVALNQTGYDYKRAGEGGFMPFGWSGVMAGAAKCFYGFVGFDVIATTGEEAKKPSRNIPLAIIASLFIIFLSYFGIASVLTMMLPYYEQDENTPLVKAFEVTGLHFLEYGIRLGAISALTASLLGSIFPLPRILYAMAEDGLLFEFLANINSLTKTPVVATLLAGLLSAIVSGIFDLEQLMDMMSIGTLLAYTIVTICVLLLRFKGEEETFKQTATLFQPPTEKSVIPVTPLVYNLKLLFNLTRVKYPSHITYFNAKVSMFSYCIFIALLCFSFNFAEKVLNQNARIYLYAILAALTILSYIILARQPQNNESILFKVPLVPVIPCISIMMNVYLMVKLDVATWFRFVIWLAIGFVIYFCYSISNSVQGKDDKLAIQRQQQDSAVKKIEKEMNK